MLSVVGMTWRVDRCSRHWCRGKIEFCTYAKSYRTKKTIYACLWTISDDYLSEIVRRRVRGPECQQNNNK